MWKLLFIGGSILALYFSYGIAQQGGPWAFFAGCTVGCIVTYLFMRYKSEAASQTMTNNQSVNVNVSQHKIQTLGDMTADQLVQLVENVWEHKLLQQETMQNGRFTTAQRENVSMGNQPTRAELLNAAVRRLHANPTDHE